MTAVYIQSGALSGKLAARFENQILLQLLPTVRGVLELSFQQALRPLGRVRSGAIIVHWFFTAGQTAEENIKLQGEQPLDNYRATAAQIAQIITDRIKIQDMICREQRDWNDESNNFD